MAKKRSTVLLLSLASSAVLGGCGSDAASSGTQSELGKTGDMPTMTSEPESTGTCNTPVGICAPPPTGSSSAQPSTTTSSKPVDAPPPGLQVQPPPTTTVPHGDPTTTTPPFAPGMMAEPPVAPPGLAPQPPVVAPGLVALPPEDAGVAATAEPPIAADAGAACDGGDCAATDAGDTQTEVPCPPIFGGIVLCPPTEGSGGSDSL
jgi:hypothetical protein